jgi:hypothetical protein
MLNLIKQIIQRGESRTWGGFASPQHAAQDSESTSEPTGVVWADALKLAREQLATVRDRRPPMVTVGGFQPHPGCSGALVAALGARIWQERLAQASLARRDPATMWRGHCVHFEAQHQLVAIFNTELRRLSVRRSANAPFDQGVWKDGDIETVMRPASAGSAPASEFVSLSIHDALWHFAQLDVRALDDLPDELGRSPLDLKRLPRVSPSLIAPRQLALILRLSRNPQSFSQLQAFLPSGDVAQLCIDLAGLHVTGCLRAAADPIRH